MRHLGVGWCRCHCCHLHQHPLQHRLPSRTPSVDVFSACANVVVAVVVADGEHPRPEGGGDDVAGSQDGVVVLGIPDQQRQPVL